MTNLSDELVSVNYNVDFPILRLTLSFSYPSTIITCDNKLSLYNAPSISLFIIGSILMGPMVAYAYPPIMGSRHYKYNSKKIPLL